jgi:hypothetical protein
MLYPTLSELPGTEVLKGVRDEQQLGALVRHWQETETTKWAAAKTRLWDAALSGAAPAFSTTGRIDRYFWLMHDLDSTEVQMFRFRRSDLARVLMAAAEKPQSACELKLAILPPSRTPSPTAGLMTACEVLTWIAFGEALTRPRLGADEILRLDTWGTTQLDDLVVALGARAEEHPYTPLAGAFRKPWFMDSYIGRYWAKTMRTLRRRARHRERQLISFANLRDRLARERDRFEHGRQLLETASSELREALAASWLTAFGQRHEGAEHESIKATVFMDSTISVNWWNTVESEAHGRRFEDVQFRTAEVLVVWPASSEGDLTQLPWPEAEPFSASRPIKTRQGSARVRRGPRSRLTDELLELHTTGMVDIRTHHRGDLHKRVLAALGIKDGTFGSSKPTFERALAEAEHKLTGLCSEP